VIVKFINIVFNSTIQSASDSTSKAYQVILVSNFPRKKSPNKMMKSEQKELASERGKNIENVIGAWRGRNDSLN
jgi:hypothetical protein